MDGLPLCRVCLAQSVPLIIVVNKEMRELYERLTDVPFETYDCREMYACHYCCAQLKKIHRFITKCQEADQLFIEMSEQYERRAGIGNHVTHFHGLVRTPIENINISEPTGSVLKEALRGVPWNCDGVLQPKIKIGSDTDEEKPTVRVKTEIVEEPVQPREGEAKPSGLDLTHKPSQLAVSDRTDHVLPVRVKIEVVEEPVQVEEVAGPSGVNFFTARTNQEETVNRFDNHLDITHEPPRLAASGRIHQVPLVTVKTEVVEEPVQRQEVEAGPSGIKFGSARTSAPILKKVKPEKRRTEKEDECIFNQTIQNRTVAPINTSFNLQYDLKLKICKNEEIPEENKIEISIDNIFQCDFCQQCYSKKCVLKRHILRMHTEDQPYKCDMCPRSFSYPSALKHHVRVHKGEKPFTCNICQRSYFQRDALTRHMRTHTGDKPYKCNTCERSFYHSTHLRRHILIHNDGNRFKCDVCERRFRDKDKLKSHTRVHTGEKPYVCDVCQRGFSDGTTLKKHYRIHTGEKPYKCEICQESFRNKSTLTYHAKSHANKNKRPK